MSSVKKTRGAEAGFNLCRHAKRAGISLAKYRAMRYVLPPLLVKVPHDAEPISHRGFSKTCRTLTLRFVSSNQGYGRTGASYYCFNGSKAGEEDCATERLVFLEQHHQGRCLADYHMNAQDPKTDRPK